MLTLIMWHNRFSENENEAVEAHIPRHRDSKTKKPRHRDSKTKKPRHRETETINPWHRDSKTFFQRTKSYDIEIPGLKSHDIKFPQNSDPELCPLIFSECSVFRCSWFYSMPLDRYLRCQEEWGAYPFFWKKHHHLIRLTWFWLRCVCSDLSVFCFLVLLSTSRNI